MDAIQLLVPSRGWCNQSHNNHSRADSLESQLACELENGRLVRLLAKFGFINERPEYARTGRPLSIKC
jgi:Pan3 Pseudokinase domain